MLRQKGKAIYCVMGLSYKQFEEITWEQKSNQCNHNMMFFATGESTYPNQIFSLDAQQRGTIARVGKNIWNRLKKASWWS